MIPKYDHRWAVTKDRRVFGPGKVSDSAFGPRFNCNEGGDRVSNLKIFTTEQEARAYAERKSWLHRWVTMPAKWWQFWLPQSGWRGSCIGGAIVIVIAMLTACASPTSPVIPTCSSTVWNDSLGVWEQKQKPCGQNQGVNHGS